MGLQGVGLDTYNSNCNGNKTAVSHFAIILPLCLYFYRKSFLMST